VIAPPPHPPVERFLCLCGCGEATNIIKRNHFKRNRLKGQFAPYLPGHQNRGKSRTGSGMSGKKRSEESKRKQGKAISGSNHWNWKGGIASNRGAKGRPKGEKHWNWQGGITPLGVRQRNDERNKKWRRSVFKRDNFTCLDCGKVGGKLNAHHIQPWAECPELRFVLENGRTLCTNCHRKEHGWRGY
jgi:5-methylcytosine-specific restriction endonuclease McrA